MAGKLKTIINYFFLTIILLCLLSLSINFWVVISTADQVHKSTSDLKNPRRVGLVLGTSPKTMIGEPNPFFETRMNKVAELYQEGLITHILVSGDNQTRYYNEPNEMKKALIVRGIPAEDITMDLSGLRTLDSIVRCYKIFGQSSFILVTQSFHSPRAVFIANFYGFEVEAVTADDPDGIYIRVMVREWLARTFMIFDLYVWNKQPMYLGEPQNISTL